MLVAELMSADPLWVEPGAPAIHALDLMVDEGVRHLPVVDPAHRVVGVVSIDDLAAALPVAVSLHHRPEPHDRRKAGTIRVGAVMTYAPDTVSPATRAEDAARHMARKGIGCLPVVDEEARLVGLLSETDVLQAFADAGGEARPAEASAERLAQAFRGERERIAHDLALRDQVGPSLVAMRLRSLEDAVARARRGELGGCVRCKGSISANRLRALPGTTLCSACAREVEW